MDPEHGALDAAQARLDLDARRAWRARDWGTSEEEIAAIMQAPAPGGQ